MNRFEECYRRTRFQLKTLDFFKSLPDGSFKSDLSLVFDADGPNRTFNGTLIALRKAIAESVIASSKTEVLVAGCSTSKGKGLVGMLTN